MSEVFVDDLMDAINVTYSVKSISHCPVLLECSSGDIGCIAAVLLQEVHTPLRIGLSVNGLIAVNNKRMSGSRTISI